MRRLVALVSVIAGCPSEPQVVDSSPDSGENEPVCAPGTRTCGDGELFVCQDDGMAFVTIPCEGGCQDDACIVLNCPPSSQRCLDETIAESCDENGKALRKACTHGCLNGECTDIVCTAGLLFCEPHGTKLLRCSVDGLTIEDVSPCPYGCDAGKAECLPAACQPGDVRCADSTSIEQCNEAQTGWEPAGITCEEKCVDGACFVSNCQPGEQKCGATGVETCNSGGTAFAKTQDCDWGCLTNGSQAVCASCLPGAYTCIENTVVVCEDPFQGWLAFKECKEIDTCAGGTCVKVLSLAGSPTATSTLLALTEALAACWLQMKSQDKKDDLCRGLHTAALEGDIDRVELMDWFCENADEAITADDFSETEQFAAAKDVMGCGLLSFNNLTVNTPGEKIHAGLSQVECIGHEKNEVIVAPCETFKN